MNTFSDPCYSHVSQIDIQRLRVIDRACLELSSGINMISGLNAAGKTSICEAFSLLFHGRSFRAAATFPALIQQNATGLQLRARLDSDDGQFTRLFMSKPVSGSWLVKRDDEPVKRLQDITQLLPLMILSPELNNLVDVEPSDRRKSIDWLMFHVEHSYGEVIKQYKHCLKQRNYLLRTKNKFDGELYAWTDELIRYGSILGSMRSSTLSDVNKIFQGMLEGTDFEGFQILHNHGWVGDSFEQAVKGVSQMELRRRTTLVGPHRADLVFVDALGRQVKPFLSRGEKKRLSVLLSVSLLHYLRQARSQKVMLLVDDWRAELDEQGRDLILSVIAQSEMQAIITTTEQSDDRYLAPHSKMFHVEHGRVQDISISI